MTTIFYPDLSDVGNHGLHLEPATVAVGAKCTEGNSFADPSCTFFQEQAKKINALFFNYHWIWSDHPDEVAWAKKHIGVLPMFIDAENLKVLITVPMIVSFVKQYRALGGHVFGVYLPQWYWSGHMGSPDLTPLKELGLILISSNYAPYSDTGPGWTSYGGMTPTIWQYTDRLPYNNQHVDFNAFKGTVLELKGVVYGVHPKIIKFAGWIPGFYRALRAYRKFHHRKVK